MTAIGFVALTVGAAAVVEDLAHRRISNWTSGTALVSGFIVHAVQQGWHGAVSAAAGASVGFAVFAVFYLLNGLGGGDLKFDGGFWQLAWTGDYSLRRLDCCLGWRIDGCGECRDSGGAPEIIRWASDSGCRRHTLRAGHCCGCVAGRDCPGIEIEKKTSELWIEDS